ncbi:hypothetical protein [Novosphingobium sp. TH158]|uniref:hypothetical protein n=1 Tax=Novosphingobium sp. TH158 TaxID=2067455 RepID=UPI0011819FB9|nr:hypothetical protein [Novosphingobium sp. TH158]
MSGEALARAAMAFVGCPFRLHGRDPAAGLDCIGLIEASLLAIGRPARLPNRYALRTGRWHGLDEMAQSCGFALAPGAELPGDICLFRPSAMQMHFAITGPDAAIRIEAHAGLRKVVATPTSASTPLRRWRMD